MPAIWQALFANVALIAILLLAWEILSDFTTRISATWRSLLFGAVMGFGAIASMMTASEIVPGVIFDLRASLISAAGLFGGLPAALVSTAFALAYRIPLGGIGLSGGMASIVIAYGIGLLAHRLTIHRQLRYTDIVVFAFAAPLASLIGYLVLPHDVWVVLIARTGVPVVILSFAATLLIASALYRDRRRRELARGNLIYRSMVEELPDCLNVKDREGRFLAANPPTAHLMQAGSVAALIGKTDYDFYSAELARQFRADEEEVLASGTARLFDQPAHFPDGSQGCLSTLKAPLRDEAGQVIGIITHNRDITEEKRNQEIKNDFISTVSHELRTPLTSIRGSLGLIAAGVAGPLPPKVENLVRIAHSNSERLVLLINDILDMEKIESGKMSFDIRPLKLRPVVEHAIHAAGSYRAEKGVRLLLVDDAPGSVVEIDPDRLHQAFSNLLSNAIKYSPDNGIVWVRISSVGEELRLSVTDQGAGIPEAFRSRIFGKFEQADSSSTREKGGTGLGLSITKAIIEHMRGRISFETEDGKGTTFSIDLPKVTETVHATSGTLSSVQDGRRRVLICEDEGDIAAVIAAMLAHDGFASDVAPDLASAKTLLAERRYAALTLDIDLAGESGIQLFQNMRTSPANAGLPVVVISAMADEARRSINGSAVGIVDWLEKPIDPERLHSAMQKIIATEAERPPRVLHVEDDEDVLEVMSAGLGKDVAMSFARSLAEARERLSGASFDLVILDLALPDGSGLDLIGDIAGTPVIIFSAAEVEARLSASVKAVMTKTKTSEIDVAKFVRTLLTDHRAKQ